MVRDHAISLMATSIFRVTLLSLAAGLTSLFVTIILSCIPIYLWLRHLRAQNLRKRTAFLDGSQKRIVGFFHPYCNAGGGGERVLWTAIGSLQHDEPEIVSVVYSGDIDASKEQIIAKVKARFDISLDPQSLHFVFLRKRWLVEDATWPRFTMLGQSLGSMVLAWEAMLQLIPDLYIDTMGYAFTLPVVKFLGGINVGAYVHYPTISTDMVRRVNSRRHLPAILTQAKLLYYRILMYYYALCLQTSSFLMANSSWTKNHVDSILRRRDWPIDIYHILPPQVYLGILLRLLAPSHPEPLSAHIVHPSCPTDDMAKFPLTDRERVIVSIAQFRPEKDHKAQLLSFAELLKRHPEYKSGSDKPVKLVLIGGSRNEGDAARVKGLQDLSKSLGIDDQTQFIVNAPYPEMLSWLGRASIGFSTMVDEHFGINVVEFMAAGAIPVAHASAGPLLDIVVPFQGGPTGYHAREPESFAEALHQALTLHPAEALAMRQRARACAVEKFSDVAFMREWRKALGPEGWRHWFIDRLT
ncbi:mannosyltransferase [Mycena floridula]|nr:mannosyltransferase [Mycena floridula]